MNNFIKKVFISIFLFSGFMVGESFSMNCFTGGKKEKTDYSRISMPLPQAHKEKTGTHYSRTSMIFPEAHHVFPVKTPTTTTTCTMVSHTEAEMKKERNRVRALYPDNKTKGINLKDKNIFALSTTMNTWEKYTIIDLSDNAIAAVSPCIQKTKCCYLLDLSNNNLTSVPDEIALIGSSVNNTTNPISIFLHDNPITSLPKKLFDVMKQRNLALNLDTSVITACVLPFLDEDLIQRLNDDACRIENEDGYRLLFEDNRPYYK